VAVLVDANTDPELPALGDVPVVRCPLPSSLRAAESMGVRAILSKPVSRDELLAAVDRLDSPVRRVLIADDDPEMVRLFERVLSSRLSPQECLAAHTGSEVLNLLSAERPDLLLLDLVMPDVSGQEVLKHMAADPRLAGIPVIVISAHAQDAVSSELGGDIRISRSSSFRLGEIFRVLEALFDALGPGWQ
jgi:CheY-like chemotaxis protein